MVDRPTRYARAGIGLSGQGFPTPRWHCGFRCLDSRTVGVKGHMPFAYETFVGYDRFGFIQESVVQADSFDVGTDPALYGLGTATLDAFTLSGTGTVGAAANNGTLSVTLDAFTASGTAKAIVTGTLATTTPAAFTMSGTATALIRGTLATTTPGTFTALGTAKAIVSGTAAITLDAFTASASGDSIASGTGTATLDPFTLAGTGAAIISGSLAVTLGSFTLSGTGGGPTNDAFTALGFQNDAFQLTPVDAVFQSDAFQSDTFPTLGADPTVLPASGSGAGAFSTSGSFNVTYSTGATLAGAGAVTAGATKDAPAFAGFVQADAFQSTGDTPTVYDRPASGAGAFFASGDFAIVHTRSATLVGTGYLTDLSGTDIPFPRTVLIGYGDMTATGGRTPSGIRADLDGGGIVTVAANRIHNRSASLAGAGSVTSNAGKTLMLATATLSGSATATATDPIRIRGVAGNIILSGGGVQTAAGVNGAIFTGARPAGRGTLAASVYAIRPASQNASGSGTLTVSTVAIRAASATLNGRGSMATVGKKTNRAAYPVALLIGV
jgi:hypothetical protein